MCIKNGGLSHELLIVVTMRAWAEGREDFTFFTFYLFSTGYALKLGLVVTSMLQGEA